MIGLICEKVVRWKINNLTEVNTMVTETLSEDLDGFDANAVG